MPLTTQHMINIFSPESCPVTAAPLLPQTDSLTVVRQLTTAADVYGPKSLVPPDTTTTLANIYQYSFTFQAIILALLILYIIIVLRFRHQTIALLHSAWSGESDYTVDYDLSDAGFKAMILLCVALMWGVLGVWTIKLWHIQLGISPLSAQNDWIIASMFALAPLSIIFIKRFTLIAAGSLTLSNDFINYLNFKRFARLVSMTILTVPLILSGVLVCNAWSRYAFLATATTIAINASLLIWKSFHLFVKQKISILVWILYLCTVELIPITIVVITAIRNWSV